MERFYQSAGVMIDVSNDEVETSVQRLKAAVEEIRAK